MIFVKDTVKVTIGNLLRELKGGNTLNLLLRECMFIAACDQMIEIFGA